MDWTALTLAIAGLTFAAVGTIGYAITRKQDASAIPKELRNNLKTRIAAGKIR